MKTPTQFAILALGIVLTATTAAADDLTIPNAFTAGTPARAAEVNANFAAVEASVDDNATTIAGLMAQVADFENRLAAAELLLANSPDPTALYAELDNKVTVGEPICSTKVAGRGMYLRDATTGEITTNVIKYTYDGFVDNTFLLVYTIDLANNYNRQIELLFRSNWATSTGGLFDAACIIP